MHSIAKLSILSDRVSHCLSFYASVRVSVRAVSTTEIKYQFPQKGSVREGSASIQERRKIKQSEFFISRKF